MTPPLILASSSVYRRELLLRLKIPFSCISPEVDESPKPGETVAALALRLSILKAQTVAQQHPGAIVIGADQAASLAGQIIGKPGSLSAAQLQLARLSGQTVVFHSALTVLLGPNYCKSMDVPTTCVFRTLTASAIQRYVQIDQPSDTAGSAKAECLGIALMERMDSSDPTAIIGLPLIALTRMLCEVGLDPLEHAKV